MIGMGLFGLLRRLGFMYPSSAAVSGAVVLLFGVMTGNSVSAVRAIVMFICSVGACVLGKKYDILSAVSLSAIILIIKNPYIIMNSGFLLSFTAIAGVAVVSGGFTVKGLKWLTGPIAIWLATLPVLLWFYYEIPVYSVVLNLFVVPLMSFIMVSALGCGFVGLVSIAAGKFFAGAGHYIILLFKECCELILGLPGSIFVAGRPKMWQIAIYYVLLILFSLRKQIMKKVKGLLEGRDKSAKALTSGSFHMAVFEVMFGVFGLSPSGKSFFVFVLDALFRGLCIVAVFIVLIFRSGNGFEITFLDTGQGDAIYLCLPDGINIFIDGGSTSAKKIYDKVIEPFLKYKGVRRLDFLFITHSDKDHENGWSEALSKLMSQELVYIPEIENLVLNECDYDRYIRELNIREADIDGVDIGKRSGIFIQKHIKGRDEEGGNIGELDMEAADIGDFTVGDNMERIEYIATALKCTGANILCAKQGMTFGFADCSLISLNQCDSRACGNDASENDNSIVLLLKYKGFSGLFTGDLTSNKEPLIAKRMAAYGIKRLSLLKVGHHGSKYSSGEMFLNTIMPQAAVISCLAGNSYGHPHTETLERLEAVGTVLFRTDIGGAVTVTFDEASGCMNVTEYVR